MSSKKNGTLSLASLAQDLSRQAAEQLQSLARPCGLPTYRFDAPAQSLPVLKSRARRVVSGQHGPFVAVEVMRTDPHDPQAKPQRSADLAHLVPPRSCYAFDLIAQVGRQTFLEGQTLAQVQQALQRQNHSVHIPLSSLQDLKMKFLFYLGQLHRQAAPQLKAYLQQRTRIQWVIDGTLEAGTPVFFGVKEAGEGWLLACRKIPTENVSDIQAALLATAADYGEPAEIWHDLSPVMAQACPAALPQVAHWVCHFHLGCDIGRDLYAAPQGALFKRLQALRLQGRLKAQRRSQAEQLQAQMRPKTIAPVLQALWAGQALPQSGSPTLGREILLACHLWILDYASEGHRQGFPFDPHLLYYHRRILRVAQGLEGLRAQPKLWAGAPAALHNFQQLLSDYLADPQVEQSAAQFEAAYTLFERLRAALRLSAAGPRPLREAYALPAPEARAVRTDLEVLREDLRKLSQQEDLPAQDRKPARIVLTHLDRYWTSLGWPLGQPHQDALPLRTTNALETHWTQGKRMCRQIHGRSHLTRDFQALPAEFMLVPNLRQESYLQQVLGGGLDRLANKFAELPLPQGGFHRWRQDQRPEPCGRLPKRILREEHFIDKLLDFWPDRFAPPLAKTELPVRLN